MTDQKLNPTCEENLISTLILTDMVLLANYFFGIFLFSKGETEYLFRLACHVCASKYTVERHFYYV